MSEYNADPRHVLIVGDVHGNLEWMLHVLDEADKLFTRVSEPYPRIVIQLGDFGFRPVPDNPDLQAMDRILGTYGMELWFIDGNHDYHPDLARIATENQFDTLFLQPGVTLPDFRNVQYLPRGTRWTWRARTWLAVGGAASVDRLALTEGVDWWPTEEISEEQEDAIVSAGPADVLLAHDCPDAWVPFDKMMPLDVIQRDYRHWIPELPRARAHSQRLERIARATGVTSIYHGHYHVTRDDYYRMLTRADVHVVGLNADEAPGNYTLVDVEAVCGGSDRTE
jgi:hypothetical protein